MTKDEALKMALEALGNASDALRDGDYVGCQSILHKQVSALCQALDEPPNSTTDVVEPESTQSQELFGKTERLESENKRLQEREWIKLTDAEIAEAVGSPLDEVYLADFRKVEAKLKEKNNA